MAGDKYSLVVVIPTWNGREHLARCLPALASQSRTDFATLVVDNGSTDGTLGWIRAHHPRIATISLAENRGFAAACNAGIRATTAPLVLLLNNDTIPDPSFVASLVRAAEQHPDIGMFATTLWLQGPQDTSQRVDAAGIGIDRLGVAWNVARGAPVSSLPETPRAIFGPCAGAALWRRTVFDDIGLFDESYFAYLEDAEFAWRAQWAGWQTLWVPGARAWHAHSATGGQVPAFKFWLLGRNRLWTILRHYPRPYLRKYAPLIVLNELLTGILGAITLRHTAPVAGRLSALRAWHATDCRQASPRRRTPQAIFDLLTPVASPVTIWSRYRRGSGISFP